MRAGRASDEDDLRPPSTAIDCQVPLKMSGTHLVKLLGNRAEVYIQVEDFTSAEEDVTKVRTGR